MKKTSSKYIDSNHMNKIESILKDGDKQLFHILKGTGIRIGEVAEYVNLVKNTTDNKIKLQPQKNNEARVLPVYPADKINFSLETKSLKQRISRWDLGVSAHDFRATFITRLLESGVDSFMVQKLVGHKNIASTSKYNRLNTENNLYLYEIADKSPLDYSAMEKHDLIKRIQQLEIERANLINMNRSLIEDQLIRKEITDEEIKEVINND